jgi:peroxiredoxin
MNWNRKTTWYGLMALLFTSGVVWIAFSRVPAEVAAARSERPPAPQVDFAAPDFSLETLDGEMVNLSDLRGQVVLVNFWATWCPPCRAEMPAIQQVYDRYRDRGFTVLAVDMQESEAEVTAFAEEMDLSFPILIDGNGRVFSRYRVKALPSTFFVDQAGIIREITIGGPMTEAFIKSQITGLLAAEGRD